MRPSRRPEARRSACLTFVAVLTGTLVMLTSPANAIVGGELDGNRHPGVGMMIGYDENGESFFACSGTLVSQTVFVTAAHCTGGAAGLVPAFVRVTFGAQIPLDAEGAPAPTLTILGEPHPNPLFSEDEDLLVTFEQIAQDYGVVVLSRPANRVFPDVTLYDLPPKGFLDRRINRDTFTLVGYGLSASSKHFKDLSFDGFRRLAEVDTNGASLSKPGVLQMLANPNGKDTLDGVLCSGDSGGATLDGSVLVAANSAGDFCVHKTYSARLDTRAALEFIGQYLSR
jgi:hypothetical protein